MKGIFLRSDEVCPAVRKTAYRLRLCLLVLLAAILVTTSFLFIFEINRKTAPANAEEVRVDVTYSNINDFVLETIGEGQFAGARKITGFQPSLVNQIKMRPEMKFALDFTDFWAQGIRGFGERAFADFQGLVSVTLPSWGINSQFNYCEPGVFSGCTSLVSINAYPQNGPNFFIPDSMFENCTSLNDVSDIVLDDYYGNSTKLEIGNRAFAGCKNLNISAPIYSGASVTASFGQLYNIMRVKVGDYAFQDCEFVTQVTGNPPSFVSIDWQLWELGVGAFSGAKIPKLSIYKSTPNKMPDRLFKDAIISGAGLIQGNMPAEIGREAFAGATFKSIDSLVLGGATVIGDYAFSGSDIRNGISLSKATSIGDYAFSDCEYLTGFASSDKLETMGRGVFSGCSALTNFKVPKNVDSMVGVLDGSSVKNITFASDATSVQDYLLDGLTGITSVTVPASVTDIGKRAFAGCTGTIEIAGEITTLGEEAFAGCTSLTATPAFSSECVAISNGSFRDCSNLVTVNFPENLVSIGDNAFTGTQIQELVFPENLVSIGDNAFAGTSIQLLVIPDSVETLGLAAFSGCALTGVKIGAGLTSLAGDAFAENPDLSNIEIAEGNTAFVAEDNIIYNIEKTQMIMVPNSLSGEVNIPEGIISLNAGLFAGKEITAVTIPETMTEIPDNLFKNCRMLESIVLPENITRIGNGAFYGNNRLREMIVPDSVTEIGKQAFAYSGLRQITLPEGLTALSDGMFEACGSLTLLEIPSGIKSVGEGTFKESAIIGIGFGDELQSIGASAFEGCVLLDTFGFNDGLQSIGASAFEGCKALTSVRLPSSVGYIGEAAFANCENLLALYLSESLGDIPDRLAYGSAKLSYIYIPEGVRTIGASICSGNTLDTIFIPSSVTSIAKGAFAEVKGINTFTIFTTALSKSELRNLFEIMSINVGYLYVNDYNYYRTVRDSIGIFGGAVLGYCYRVRVAAANEIEEYTEYIHVLADGNYVLEYADGVYQWTRQSEWTLEEFDGLKVSEWGFNHYMVSNIQEENAPYYSPIEDYVYYTPRAVTNEVLFKDAQIYYNDFYEPEAEGFIDKYMEFVFTGTVADGTEYNDTKTPVNAGNYEVTVRIKTGYSFSLPEPTDGVLIINKTDLRLPDGISLADSTVNYDGNAHGLQISGNLSDDYKVTYEYSLNGEGVTADSVKEVGEYEVKAYIQYVGADKFNYNNDLFELKAKLRINEAADVGPGDGEGNKPSDEPEGMNIVTLAIIIGGAAGGVVLVTVIVLVVVLTKRKKRVKAAKPAATEETGGNGDEDYADDGLDDADTE